MVTWKCKALACNCTLILRYVNMTENAPVLWNVKRMHSDFSKALCKNL